jgi:hypothetical protein
MRKAFPIVPLLFGSIAFMNVARNPRFEAIHNVDIANLMASGACFGVALAMLIGALRSRSSR